MITRNFKLYLNAGKTVPPVIHVNQYDQGEEWVFTLYTDSSSVYVPSTGAIVGIKSDGFGIADNAEVDEEGRVIVTETQQMTASAGEALFELQIDGGTHGTANFVVKVEEKPTDSAIMSDSDIPLIQQAVDAADRIVNYGSPYVASSASLMTDTKKVYVYTGNETGYVNGNWYYWNGSAWTSGGVYNAQGINTDTTLSISGAAADAKATGDALKDKLEAYSVSSEAVNLISENMAQIPVARKSYVDAQDALKLDAPSETGSVGQVLTKTANGTAWAAGGSGLTTDIKEALLACFAQVAWVHDDGQDYYDALESALYPPNNLLYIDAVYTQSGDIFETSTLDDLRADLVVTAYFDDATSSVIMSYILTGDLNIGTSTITATYGGKSDTFTVNVTEYRDPPIYSWNFKQSLVDTVGGSKTFELINTNGDSSNLPTRDSDGLHFTAAEQVAQVAISLNVKNGWLYEFDVASAEFAGNNSYHKRLLLVGDSMGLLIFRNTSGKVEMYRSGWAGFVPETGKTIPTSTNDFSGKTVGIRTGKDGWGYLYIDGELIGKAGWTAAGYQGNRIAFGGEATGTASAGNQIHNMTITGFRIYDTGV